MSEPVGSSGRRPAPAPSDRRGFNAWNGLLLVPIVGTLLPWTYDMRTPLLFNIPFFYWYQMAWIVISVICTVVVYRATKGRR